MVGEDDGETVRLQAMLHEAKDYLSSFEWCTSIVEEYLGFGVGGIIALFLFRLAPPIAADDEWLWVVVGDVPSAYFVVDRAPNPAAALGVYCDLMESWANTVLDPGRGNETYPVHAAANAENARRLLGRTRFIREKLIPMCP